MAEFFFCSYWLVFVFFTTEHKSTTFSSAYICILTSVRSQLFNLFIFKMHLVSSKYFFQCFQILSFPLDCYVENLV